VRLEVGPAEVTVTPGEPVSVVAQVFNSDDVINAYEIRVFGVDQSWVELERERLSLFPSSAGIVTVNVTVPEDYPAGALQLGIEVTPVVDPAARQLGNVTIIVAARKTATMSVDPQSLITGKTGDYNLTFTNEGNAPFELELHALDPEAKVATTFNTGVAPKKRKKQKKGAPPEAPASISIVPGEQVIVPVRTKARPPIMGQPASRLVTFTAKGSDNPLETIVSFVQKPVLGRGLISLFGLLMAITIMALVLTTTLNRVVDVAKIDTALLKRAVEGAPTERGIPDNPSTVSGKVTQLSTGAPVQGATAELFLADDPSTPIMSAVTIADGTYTLPYLKEGTYKVRFRGAGFLEIWYESATTFEDATEFDVAEGAQVGGIDMVIGALPGSIAGTVIALDATDAVVSLQVPSPDPAQEGSLLQQVTVGADGAFLLENVPAPASYDLVVTKAGYSQSTRTVNLAAAEAQEGIEIRLRRGDGVISGVITDDSGNPLGSVTVTATNTVDEVSTVSLTNGDDQGRFTLRNLPTPSTYTITFTKDGYATENVTVPLGQAEERGPDLITLAKGTGSISGAVSLAGEGPVGGVVVTISDGETSRVTETLSVGDIGSFIVTNLPIPGTYTVTFSGAGMASQVRSVDLDVGSLANVEGINASLTAATASVSGTVSDVDGPLGGVAVELTDGTVTLTTQSADDPAGEYVLTGVPPGTYTLTFRQTGAVPSSVLVTLAAGEQRVVDVEMKPQATITGTVRRTGSGGAAAAPLAGAQVTAFRVAEFPTVVAATAISGADGTYTLTDLTAPDEYVIEFSYPVGSLPGASVRVLLDAGQQRAGVDATITLPGEA
jgi:uncharacterized membrane protein